MGKYAKVLAGLPRFVGAEPAYQAKVNAVKLAMVADAADDEIPLHGNELARRHVLLREHKEAVEAELSDLNLQLEAVNALLADQYEVEGTSSITLADGQSVSVQLEPYSQVADKEAHRLWCVANGLERSLVLPWQTTNALAKDLLVKGEALPDGVTVFVRPKIVRRKG